MKSYLPVLVGVGVVAVGLGVLILWQPEPQPKDLAAASLEHYRAEMRAKGKVEGKDFIVDVPAILRRTDDELIVRLEIRHATGEMTREYHRLIFTSKGWEFDRDLAKDFGEFALREQKPACDRLGQQLVERYQGSVDIPGSNVRIGHRLQEGPTDAPPEARLAGYIDIVFVDQGFESRYVEKFLLKNGSWTMEGSRGQLFDRGPRPKQ